MPSGRKRPKIAAVGTGRPVAASVEELLDGARPLGRFETAESRSQARFEAFDREEAALAYLRAHHDYPTVVKADGAAAGKGVTVAHTQDEAEEAVRASFAGKFGAAGERIVIEEYLEGREASIFVVTDGQDILPFLPAQDNKRAYDGDEGPNTGGMGSYSPIMWMEPATYAAILEDIISPTIHQLALIGTPYTGLLYAGVMVTETGPKALEFFYDEDHVRRAGALPEPVVSTLFGHGAVHTLDGAAHRARRRCAGRRRCRPRASRRPRSGASPRAPARPRPGWAGCRWPRRAPGRRARPGPPG